MYRKLYIYICEGECKKKRSSLNPSRKTCTKCERNKVSEDQMSLFDIIKIGINKPIHRVNKNNKNH